MSIRPHIMHFWRPIRHIPPGIIRRIPLLSHIYQIRHHSSNFPVSSRFLDRHHRSLIHQKNPKKLQPNISNFLVELDLHSRGRPYSLVKSFVPDPYHKRDVFPVVLYGILSSLQLSPDLYHQDKVLNLRLVYQKLTGKQYNCQELDQQTFEPIAHTLDVKNHELFNISMACMAQIDSRTHQIVPWIKSILAPSIVQACSELATLSNIPGSIISDILLRQPLTKLELNLQLELWLTFTTEICSSCHQKPSAIKTLIENLVYHICRAELPKLPEFISHTIEYLKSSKSGYTYNVISDQYLNQMLWKVAYDSVEAPGSNSGKSFSALMRTQEYIAKGLDLSLDGHMGIVLAISLYSTTKARVLLEKSTQKHSHRRFELSNKEKASLNYVRIALASTPQELVHTFNDIDGHTSTIWAGFIKKLLEFELLTPARTMQILKQLLANKQKVIITKNIMLHLLIPIWTLDQMAEVMGVLGGELEPKMGEESHKIITLFNTLLTEKYMTILYQNHGQTFDPQYLSLVADIDKNETDCLKVARTLYEQSKRKRFSSGVIGRMLEIEAKLQPEKAYELFKSEVKDRELVPNDKCLIALIKASMNTVNSEPYIWEEMYAPQVAIHEFKMYADEMQTSDLLWQTYIEMLAKYSYIDELSGIMQWWEKQEFVPSRETLMDLLRALPEEFSRRHIMHREKVGGGWPWPTVEEFTT